MGKASRRKKQASPYWSHPIQVRSEESGELIDEFVDPDLARRLNDMIAAGNLTKEEITKLVSEGINEVLRERRKNAPIDGQHRTEQ